MGTQYGFVDSELGASVYAAQCCEGKWVIASGGIRLGCGRGLWAGQGQQRGVEEVEV